MSGALSEVGSRCEADSVALPPVAADGSVMGYGTWRRDPGDRLLAVGVREGAARSGRAAPWPGWSAGGLGLVLVDALDHAALHLQGVVEQLALAGGGVLDQLGEQPLLAGRLTRAD
jgi:hypothetical protein